MDADESADMLQGRPYRSKLRRPCDVCRRRKQSCFLQDRPPCRLCRFLGVSCTFNNPPSKRPRNSQGRGGVVTSPSPRDDDSAELETAPPNGETATSTASDSQTDGNASSSNINAANTTWNSNGHAADPLRSSSRDVPNDSNGGSTMLNQFRSIDDAVEPAVMPSSSRNDIWFAATTMLDPEFSSIPAPFFNNGDVGNNSTNYFQNPFFGEPSRAASQPAAPSQLSPSSGRAPTRPAEARHAPIQNQPIRSLDTLEGPLTAYYFGLSGEMDPYLLRYMRFSDEGSLNFGQFQYRHVASGLTSDPASGALNHSVPVQFMISAPKPLLNTGSGPETEDQEQTAALNRLVSPHVGCRLVGLFLRYVFPNLPVLSRSRFEIASEMLTPKAKNLPSHPYYLLAAVYATAYSYRRYDPVLTVEQADNPFPVAALWSLAYSGILKSMHIPSLGTIQALVIYLQRPTDETAVTASTDTPGHWPLLGSIVHTAQQLGLHIDCSTWPIPAWERRLRRRLWWVISSEATWRSLTLGLPHPIQPDQWDITELQDDDFHIEHLVCPTEQTATQDPSLQSPCGFCHSGHDFRFLAELSLIAHDVYTIFYTLTAAKRLAADFDASLDASKPLLNRLNEWHTQLPERVQIDCVLDGEDRDYFHPGSAVHVKLAFISLKAHVYRACLRPLANENVPRGQGVSPNVTNTSGYSSRSQRSATGTWDNMSGDFSDRIETLRASLDLARSAIAFTRRLGSYDRNGFCYSWSRACFATISNLIMLLLVLAPDTGFAKETLSVLARWVIILREQSVIFDNMQLGLLRMDAIFRIGLDRVFRLPPHVKDCVQYELPTPNFQR